MNSAKTQISRKNVSAPTRWIVGHIDLNDKFILHHGEGKAFQDTVQLGVCGLVRPYDPASDDKFTASWPEDVTFDVAISNYVFNTLEYDERVEAWHKLLSVADRVLVSVRTDTSAVFNPKWTHHHDGFITSRGTFQCIMTSYHWVNFFKANSPKRTSVSILHDGGHFAIIDVWR